MTTVSIDINEGNTLRQTAKGFEATVVYVVKDLVSTAAAAMVLEAIDDSGTPGYGDEHDEISSIVVLLITGTAEVSGVARLVYTYGPPTWTKVDEGDELDTQTVQVDISNTLTSINTQRDINDDELEVFNAAQDASQIATISVNRPQTALTFARIENQDVFLKARTYVGKVNSVIWQGSAPKTLLCTSINGRQTDISTQRFEVTYTFIYQSEDYTRDVWWVDPDSGRPQDGGGVTNFDVYETIDFNLLNLPVID